jgi:8-oxo-dGTP diphosphatase
MPESTIRVGANALIIREDSILLVEFNDPSGGLHYNLPGGGVEVGETLHEAVRREVREETCAEVTVGPLVLVHEYIPAQHHDLYGSTQKLTIIFRCELEELSSPRLPVQPDPYQTGVKWVPLGALAQTPLLPPIADQIILALQSPYERAVFC